jgi:transcriptional regulator with XRE-family HTH domain
METLKDRVTLVRKALNLNQTEFAQKLGLTQSTVSGWAIGKSKFTESNIRLICYTFNVSEQWLRSGEGDMFISEASQEEAKFMDIYRKLSPINQKMLLEFALTMLANEQPAGPA